MSLSLESLYGKVRSNIREISQKKDLFVVKPIVLVVGQQSSGKSSFLNLITNSKMFESSVGQTTKSINMLSYDEESGYIIERANINSVDAEGEGIFFDIFETLSIKPNRDIKHLADYVSLVDTPGYNEAYDEKIEYLLQNIDFDCIIVWLLDISKGFLAEDRKMLESLSTNKKGKNTPILFLLNKRDLYEDEEDGFKYILSNVKKSVEEIYDEELIVGYLPVSIKNDKDIKEFIQDVIINTAYTLSFKTNVYSVANLTIEEINSKLESDDIKNLHNSLSEMYLSMLNYNLIERLGIFSCDEETVKGAIDDANLFLSERMKIAINEIVETAAKSYIEFFINYINEAAIVYKSLLPNNVEISGMSNQGKNIKSIDRISNIFSGDVFDNVFKGVFLSVVGGGILELALGSILIPGIGLILGAAGVIFSIFSGMSKVDKIREEIMSEAKSKVPQELKKEWASTLAKIKKSTEQQIIKMVNSKEINSFIDEIREELRVFNEALGNALIYKSQKL